MGIPGQPIVVAPGIVNCPWKISWVVCATRLKKKSHLEVRKIAAKKIKKNKKNKKK